MDEEEVTFAVDLIDSFLISAVKYDKEDERNEDLVTVLLTIAYETGLEAFGADVFTADLERTIPRDWRYRWRNSPDIPI